MEASHPEQGTLHAWVEGELDSAEHDRIEAHLAECAHCREAVAEARGLIAGASRIVSALDGAPAGVVPSRVRRGRFVPMRWAAAAAVLLFAATSVVVSREFRSGGIDLPATAIETAPPSEERVASTPALAPAAAAERPSPTTTSVPEGRRSTTPPAREPIAALSTEQARGREVRDRRAVDVEETRQVSRSADAVAIGQRVTNEADFAGRPVRGQAPGQIATTAPTLSAPPPSAPPPPIAPVPAEPRPSLERMQPTSGQRLDEVVITGAAVGPTGASSARVVRVVRYEARPGVIVTLTEYEEPQPDSRAIRIRGGRAQAAAARRESQEMPAAALSSGESAYMWRHPDGGRFYVLRGPLPRAELESLARRLSELKVVR